jgi:hypothetical protein
MLKFAFAIRTRSGPLIDSIVIAGRDQADAERKLVQMYRECNVIQCTLVPADERIGQKSREGMLTVK